MEPGFLPVTERAGNQEFRHDMVLAERIPNGLVIDVGERLKRPHAESDPRICRRSAPFRLLSISRKPSVRCCASADKLGNGTGNGFGLLQ